jgi:hypothetical protein
MLCTRLEKEKSRCCKAMVVGWLFVAVEQNIMNQELFCDFLRSEREWRDVN